MMSALKLKITRRGVVLATVVGLAAGLSMLRASQKETLAAPPVQAKDEPRRDRDGDPLPPGAVARLGTRRFRLNGHMYHELAFAPDGKTIAVASTLGLWLFDAASGKRKKHFHPPYTSFWLIAFSPDSKQLLAAGGLNQRPPKTVVQIWDVAEERKTTEVELEGIRCLGWTAEGQPLAVSQRKGEINLHEIATGRQRRFVEKKLSGTIGVPCALGKNVLAIGERAGVAHVWDRTNGKERWVFQTAGQLNSNNSLVLSADGRWLASLANDAADQRIVQLWNLTTGKGMRLRAADQPLPQAVALSPDGQTLATLDESKVLFWDTANGRERGRLKESSSFGLRISSFAPDSKTLATMGNLCGAIHLWDVATGEPKPAADGHSTNWVRTPTFSPDGKRVTTSGGLDGTIRVWDAATGRQLALLRRSPSTVLECALSSDGRTLVSCWDDKVLLSDAATGRELHVLESNDWRRLGGRAYMSMFASSDGRKAIVLRNGPSGGGGPGGAAGMRFGEKWLMACWDTITRKQLFRRQLAYGGSEREMAVSPDAKTFALPGTKREPMRLVDVETEERLLNFPIFQGSNRPLLFSRDGRLLLSHTSTPAPAPDDSTRILRLWEVLTASELLALPISIYNSANAAVSPDGRLLAAITPQEEILLWDLRRGKELHRFKDFGSSTTSLVFSPDGRRLLSGLGDSTLLIWDVAAVRGKNRPIVVDAESARRAWDDLAGDARKAFAARWTLAAAPEVAMALLKERLHAAKAADPRQLRRLLADLESEQFAVREKAQEELTELGDLAEAALRRALANKPTLETRRRVQVILERLRGPVQQSELLRSLRAVAVLEDIGTAPARRRLEELSQGASEARLTREAKASLRRLDLRKPSPPGS